jgi:hypothetical protein
MVLSLAYETEFLDRTIYEKDTIRGHRDDEKTRFNAMWKSRAAS